MMSIFNLTPLASVIGNQCYSCHVAKNKIVPIILLSCTLSVVLSSFPKCSQLSPAAAKMRTFPVVTMQNKNDDNDGDVNNNNNNNNNNNVTNLSCHLTMSVLQKSVASV